MDASDLLHFTPVPVRARRDGWTAKKQQFFILGLARGFTIGKAAAIVGMSRKTAYELRRMPDAGGFAAAWDAALARAKARRQAARPPSLSQRALHGEWHPRRLHGRLIGWEHRPANARLIGRLKRLDQQCDRISRSGDPALRDAYLPTLPPERDKPYGEAGIGCHSCHVPRNSPPLGKRPE
jgi:hypothetical protein